MVEIWKDIEGYAGHYQVSNFGRIKSLQYGSEKLLKIRSFGKYVQVILSKQGKTKCFGVHRLVAQAFIPNPDNLPCVNHKDENRNNNIVTNLEWCTYKYNNEYNGRANKCRNKISQSLKGRKRNYHLSPEQLQHIRDGARRGWVTRRKNVSAVTEMVEV